MGGGRGWEVGLWRSGKNGPPPNPAGVLKAEPSWRLLIDRPREPTTGSRKGADFLGTKSLLAPVSKFPNIVPPTGICPTTRLTFTGSRGLVTHVRWVVGG